MPRTRTRRGLAASLALVLAAGVTACGGDDDDGAAATTAAGGSGTTAAAAQDLGSMKVGLVCGGMTPIVAQIAMNTDAFEPNGLEVEKVCFDGGSEGVQALIGGGVDVFLGSYEHVQSTRERGLDTKGYAVINDVFPYWLLTKTDARYQSVADLSGETVGVTSPGSLSDTGLQAAALEAGIDYGSMKVIGAGSGATMRAALTADQIAAGMVSEPGISELTDSGYRILWEPGFDYVSIVAVAREGWVSDNEDKMRTFLTTMVSVAEEATTDPAMAVDAMKEEGFEVSDDALTSAVERMLDAVPEGLVVDEQAVQSTADILIEVGKIDAPGVPFAEGFDFSLVES